MSKLIGTLIAVIQIVDIVIHAATNQLEILRVSSNVIILLWLAGAASGKFNTMSLMAAITPIGLYLTLNIIFLASEGLTNAEQGGGFRTTLFLLVLLTTTLSSWLAYIYNTRMRTL